MACWVQHLFFGANSGLAAMSYRFRKFFAYSTLATLSIVSDRFLEAKAQESIRECPYIVKKDDTLSVILYRVGIDKSRGFPLYCKGCWVELNQNANPQISDWRQLNLGEKLRILIPSQIPECLPQLPSPPLKDSSTQPEAIKIDPPPLAPTASPIGTNPELPKEPQASTQQMPTTPVVPKAATSATETLKKKKKKKMKKKSDHWLRDRLSSTVSLRYGSAPPTGDYILLSKVRQWSAVYESRYQPMSKLRVYVDYIPRVSETFNGNDYFMKSMKLQIGRAFLFSPRQNDTIEIVPKLGYWSYHSIFPDFSDTQTDTVELKFERQLNLGLELSWEHDFGVIKPRVLAGGDATIDFLGIGGKDSACGRSYRTGVELAVRGPTIKWSTTKLTTLGYLFGIFENVTINRGIKTALSTVKETASQTSANEIKNTSYNLNIFGVGIGLGW